MTDLMSLANYGANILFGYLPDHQQENIVSPTNLAVIELRKRGHSVGPADIAGLWNVSGYPELTTGQLISVAFDGYAK